jgi:hypothetical protein
MERRGEEEDDDDDDDDEYVQDACGHAPKQGGIAVQRNPIRPFATARIAI